MFSQLYTEIQRHISKRPLNQVYSSENALEETLPQNTKKQEMDLKTLDILRTSIANYLESFKSYNPTNHINQKPEFWLRFDMKTGELLGLHENDKEYYRGDEVPDFIRDRVRVKYQVIENGQMKTITIHCANPKIKSLEDIPAKTLKRISAIKQILQDAIQLNKESIPNPHSHEVTEFCKITRHTFLNLQGLQSLYSHIPLSHEEKPFVEKEEVLLRLKSYRPNNHNKNYVVSLDDFIVQATVHHIDKDLDFITFKEKPFNNKNSREHTILFSELPLRIPFRPAHEQVVHDYVFTKVVNKTFLNKIENEMLLEVWKKVKQIPVEDLIDLMSELASSLEYGAFARL
jgi:hypothetical protein